MAKYSDIHPGVVFGRLTVESTEVRPVKAGVNRLFALCRCRCGQTRAVRSDALGEGGTNSCGCLMIEERGKSSITHGQSKTRTHNIWIGMWKRCTNNSNNRYEFYKDKIPPIEWKDYEVFLRDMGECPDGLSLERKKNELPYSKDNCVWATPTEQAQNRRSSRYLEYQGKTQTIAAWSKELEIPYSRIQARLQANWPIERVLDPISHQR